MRAMPAPAGGSASSEITVACPNPTPGTSSTELVRPRGRAPMATDQSASRALPPIRASCHAAGVAGRIPVVVDPRCADHDPQAEIWLGVRTPATEVADRVTTIESTLRGLGHDVVPAHEFDDTWLTHVHSAELIDHLATVWDRWVTAAIPTSARSGWCRICSPAPNSFTGFPLGCPPHFMRRSACSATTR